VSSINPTLPEEITLNAVDIQILRVDDLKADDGEKCNGLASKDEATIEICTSVKKHDTLRFVALHEVSHFIEDHAGLSLKETQIDSLARSMLSLIRDNPEFIAWLQAPKPTRKKKEQPTLE